MTARARWAATAVRLGTVVAALAAVAIVAAPAWTAPAGAATTASLSAKSSAVSTATNEISIRLVDVAVGKQKDPRANAYIVDDLKAGTPLTRHVQITNGTPKLRSIAVYVAGASISGGQFTFADGRTANELSSWSSVSQSTLSLSPGQSAVVAVTVDPSRTATAGERYAVVWAQTSSPSSPGTVGETNRVGIRMYLDLPGARAATTSFTIGQPVATRTADGHLVVTVAVHNTGTTAVDLTGTLTLTNGPSGLSMAPVPSDRVTTIAPGDTQPVRFTIGTAAPAGMWKATVVLSSGDVSRSAQASISFPATVAAIVAAPLPPVASSGGVDWSVLIIGGFAVLVTAGVGWALLRRHRPGSARHRAARTRA